MFINFLSFSFLRIRLIKVIMGGKNRTNSTNPLNGIKNDTLIIVNYFFIKYLYID